MVRAAILILFLISREKALSFTPLNLILLFSPSVMSDSLWPHGLQHTRLPCPSPSPGACSNPCPLSQWCHPSILSSVVPFSSCLQSLPASGSFLMRTFCFLFYLYSLQTFHPCLFPDGLASLSLCGKSLRQYCHLPTSNCHTRPLS